MENWKIDWWISRNSYFNSSSFTPFNWFQWSIMFIWKTSYKTFGAGIQIVDNGLFSFAIECEYGGYCVSWCSFCNGYFECNQRSRLSRWSPVIYFKQICASECIEMNKKDCCENMLFVYYILPVLYSLAEEKGGKPGAFAIINNLNIQQKITQHSCTVHIYI